MIHLLAGFCTWVNAELCAGPPLARDLHIKTLFGSSRISRVTDHTHGWYGSLHSRLWLCSGVVSQDVAWSYLLGQLSSHDNLQIHLSTLRYFSKNFYIAVVCVWQTHIHRELERQTERYHVTTHGWKSGQLSVTTLTWVLGLTLTVSGLLHECLYLQSHLAGPELFIYLKATVSYVAQVGLLLSSCHPTAWVSRVLGLQIYTWHQVPEHLSFLEEDPWVAEWLKGWGTRGLMKEAFLVNSNYVMQNVSIL